MSLEDLLNNLEQELHDQETAYTAHDPASDLKDASYKPEGLIENIELEAVKGTLNNFHTHGTRLSPQVQKYLAQVAMKQGMDKKSTETVEIMDGTYSPFLRKEDVTNSPRPLSIKEGVYEAYRSGDTYMTIDDASKFAGNVINGMF